MTWLLILGAVLVAGLAIAAALGIGFAKGAYATWDGIQRLNAARQDAAKGISLEPDRPKLTPEQLETHALRMVSIVCAPLTKEAAFRVLSNASQRFVVAPALEAAREEERVREERIRERQLLFVAAQVQQGKAS